MKKEIAVMTTDLRSDSCQILGLVTGSSVKAANAFKDIASNIKNLTGGDLSHYSSLIDESVKQAIEKMKQQALSLEADAVVCVRISTSNVTSGGAEIIAYGTAVKFA